MFFAMSLKPISISCFIAAELRISADAPAPRLAVLAPALSRPLAGRPVGGAAAAVGVLAANGSANAASQDAACENMPHRRRPW